MTGTSAVYEKIPSNMLGRGRLPKIKSSNFTVLLSNYNAYSAYQNNYNLDQAILPLWIVINDSQTAPGSEDPWLTGYDPQSL